MHLSIRSQLLIFGRKTNIAINQYLNNKGNAPSITVKFMVISDTQGKNFTMKKDWGEKANDM